jgi:anti-anti-sigma factor
METTLHIGTQHEDGTCRLQVDGELTIYNALQIRDGLLEHLVATDGIEVDRGGVTEMDTAGVQLLLATKREGIRLGKIVRYVSHSQAVLEVIDLYNMAAQFGDPLLISARP